MNISYQSIGQVCATFMAYDTQAGQVVKMFSNDIVGPCQAGEDFIGVLLHQRGNTATVQTDGFVEVPFSGSSPDAGWTSLCADGNGGVKVGGERKYLVVTTNTATNMLTLKL